MPEQTDSTRVADKAPQPATNPQFSDHFARVYERSGSQVTAPIAMAALGQAGPIDPSVRVLDIAAGTGALAIPAAFIGAHVTAIDVAPGMVNLLSERLAPFPRAQAQVMDGEAMTFADGSFDVAFSIMGFHLFADWRRGLQEQARVVRAGGKGCVAVWRTPLGGGPFEVMAKAIGRTFPDRSPPPPPEGRVALSDPARLVAQLEAVGFSDIEVVERDAVWEGPSGEDYVESLRDLHLYMPPYAALEPAKRNKVDAAILEIVADLDTGGRVSLSAPALLATGTRT